MYIYIYSKFVKQNIQLQFNQPSIRKTSTDIPKVHWLKNYKVLLSQCGVRGGAVRWGTALQAGRSRVRFAMMSLEFFIDIILSASLWLTQLLIEMSTRNIHLFGSKGGRSVGLTTLPLRVSILLKSGSLNLLEPSASIQACNGIALPLPLLSQCNDVDELKVLS